MTTKRIATAYLPSGKEIKFVFDEFENGETGGSYLLDEKMVSFIPFSVPIIFEDYSEPSAEPTPITLGAGTHGAKWTPKSPPFPKNRIFVKNDKVECLVGLHKSQIGWIEYLSATSAVPKWKVRFSDDTYGEYYYNELVRVLDQPITPLTDLSDYKNIIGGVDMTETHKMD